MNGFLTTLSNLSQSPTYNTKIQTKTNIIMKLNVNVLSENQVESTTTTKKMKLSENSNSIIFQMFTKNVYSNPIGTIVREITSNCFDSHVEAGVNHPVLIKKSYDEQTEMHYISFIDYGVGMSPERVEDVYCVYFESTKRLNNNEIGGFGIGGKTPLAYRRSTGIGENEYDNSFFVITNYNGTKYYYSVYEGPESPEYTLIHKESTTERNGTEVRIPVLKNDILTFEREMRNQLYYFENIVFEGFSSNYVQNDYKIFEGKNFLYRGGDVDNNVHVCLGRVYYPINYSTLGLSSYDYNIPIAIKIPIGEVNVTVSREQLDYSEKTIKYIKKKLFEVREELKSMLIKQCEDIVTLEDYFKIKNDYGKLKIGDDNFLRVSNLINSSELELKNFKYNDLELGMIDDYTLFKNFFTNGLYGKKEGRNGNHFTGTYDKLISKNNIYYTPDDFNRKMIKQSYLKSIHTRYYIVRKANLFNRAEKLLGEYPNLYKLFKNTSDFIQSPTFNRLLELQEDFFDIVQRNAINYDELEIPEDFKATYGKKRLSGEILKSTIPVKFSNRWSKERVTVEDLVNFRGKIFYGSADDERLSNSCHNIFKLLFDGSKHVAQYYYSHKKHHKFEEKKGIMFITVAKCNLKYFKHMSNAIPLEYFKEKMLYRKIDTIKENYPITELKLKYSELDSFYISDFFKELAPQWKDRIEMINTLIYGSIDLNELKNHSNYLKPMIDLNEIKPTNKIKLVEKHIDGLKTIEGKNKKILPYLKTPNPYSVIIDDKTDKETYTMIYKKLLKL